MSALTIPPFFCFTRPDWQLDERRRLGQITGTLCLWLWSLLSNEEKTHLHDPSDGWFILTRTWRKKGLTAVMQTRWKRVATLMQGQKICCKQVWWKTGNSNQAGTKDHLDMWTPRLQTTRQAPASRHPATSNA
eukprot:3813458-Rhodomonas_salina.2